MPDWLTTITATVEASDHRDHAGTAWEPSPTRVYVVRGEAPLLVAEASDMYAAVDLIADLLTERFPVTIDAVIVVSTADACDPVTGDHVDRIRVAYGLTAHHRASVIRRRSTPDTADAVGPATGAFPDALDAALRSRR
ncbi:MAG: hypothetical protein ACRD1K_07185 [Acidimicrobiales bacterium]